MPAIVAALLVIGLVTTGAAGAEPDARGLAERLERAHVCTRTRRSTDQEAAQARSMGMAHTYVCIARLPDNGAHGGVEIGVWVARSRAEQRRVLGRMLGEFHRFCASGSSSAKGSPDAPLVGPAGADVTAQYVVGRRWLALVGVNARLRAVAHVLHGHAVVRHCP